MKKFVFALFFIVLSFCFVACKTTYDMLPKEIGLVVEVSDEFGGTVGYLQKKVIKEVGAVIVAFNGEVEPDTISNLVRVVLTECGVGEGSSIEITVDSKSVVVKIGDVATLSQKMSINVVV